MKKYKSKILTVLLASALGATVLGGASLVSGLKADADEVITYSPNRIFTADRSAEITPDKDVNTDLTFIFDNQSTVSFKRDLALKWFEDGNAKFLSMTFAFKDTNFKKYEFTFESDSAIAVKEKKAINKVVFEKGNDGKVSVSVNEGNKTVVDVASDITLALSDTNGSATAAPDEFFVLVQGNVVGNFTNVGASFAEYFSASASTPMVPMLIKAFLPDNSQEKSVIKFSELNGQSFALEDGKIKDTIAPAIVVNENVTNFMLGMNFSVDYKIIDVLDTSPDKTMEYYQYNPLDAEATYKELTSSVVFNETVYKPEGSETTTSVYKEQGKEFVSIHFKVSDDSHKGEAAKTYDLSWYADKTVKPTHTDKAPSDIEYIRFDRVQGNPFYVGVIHEPNADGVMETKVSAEAQNLFDLYQASVDEAAIDLDAGSNSYFYLPSLRGMIKDENTDYAKLKFNIYYRTSSSDNQSSTSLSSDNLKISLSEDGMYEFKVTASNKLSNGMFWYVDGEKTKVTSDNIWDIDGIPSFTFSVVNSGITVEENKDNDLDKAFIDVSYTVSDFKVTALPGYKQEYALFYFDTVTFQKNYISKFSETDLNSIKFEDLKANADLSKVEDDDYLTYYAKVYAKLLLEHYDKSDFKIEVTPESLITPDANGVTILRKIDVYDSTINEKDHPDEWKASDNKYYWNNSSKSFKPQEVGAYIVIGVFTDSNLAGEKAAAYKAVMVEAEIDKIKGETQWLKNNIASVILFSIAGVLLIIIIILIPGMVLDSKKEQLSDIKAEPEKKKKNKKKNKK